MNNHTLVGRLTKKPELKYSNAQKPYIHFTLAVNRIFKGNDGRDADFFDCVAFGKTAEYVGNYADKGLQCAVVGATEIGEYTDKESIKHKTVTVKCNSVELLERKQVQSVVDIPQKNEDQKLYEKLGVDESSLPF